MQARYIAVLLLICSSSAIHAQHVKRKGVTPVDVSKFKRSGTRQGPLFSIDQFAGKWQEVFRTERDNQPLSFTDTLLLNFTGDNKVTTRETKSMISMIGAAGIEDPGNVLLAAGDVYTIISVTDSAIVLDNGESFIHTFKKTNQFFFETYGRLSVKQDVFRDPIPVTLAEVTGKWMVYRKESKPGTINPPVNIIQYLKITDSTGENTAKGEVTFYQSDKSTEAACNIKITNAGFDITSGAYTWSLFVYKAAKKELVFGEAGVLLYYAREY